MAKVGIIRMKSDGADAALELVSGGVVDATPLLVLDAH